MMRTTRPAVGKVGRPSCSGMTTPLVVSATRRDAVKDVPSPVLPDDCSVPLDLPFTVRCVLPGASPLTVRSLVCTTVDVTLPSWRVTVPLTETCSLIVFVDELGAACAMPAASVNAKDREMVRPRRVTSGHETRPVALDNVQLDKKSLNPNGPWSQPRPSAAPPKNSGPSPPPIMAPSSSRAFRSGIHASPESALDAKVLSVDLKPDGVERNAAASTDDPLEGEVDSEHAAATSNGTAARR